MVDPREDTEFNDALRKHGIIPPLETAPESPPSPPALSLHDKLDGLTLEEIDDLLLETDDSDTERRIIAHRETLTKEFMKERKLSRFGTILPISRDDYTREVAEASKVDDEEEDEGRGTGVVCFLYHEGRHPPSVRLASQLKLLAEKYPRTKFTSIVGDQCIPNYPEKMLPTLILYRRGEIKDQLVAWGARKEGTIEELEAVLIQDDILQPTRIHLPPRPKAESGGEDESGDEAPNAKNSKRRNIRGRANANDSDSDFDL